MGYTHTTDAHKPHTLPQFGNLCPLVHVEKGNPSPTTKMSTKVLAGDAIASFLAMLLDWQPRSL